MDGRLEAYVAKKLTIIRSMTSFRPLLLNAFTFGDRHDLSSDLSCPLPIYLLPFGAFNLGLLPEYLRTLLQIE